MFRQIDDGPRRRRIERMTRTTWSRSASAASALVVAACSGAPPTTPATPRAGPRTPTRPSAPAPPAPTTLSASPHVALGIPKDGDDTDDLLIDERAYVVSYNPRREVANWVAWRLLDRDLGDADRANDFRADDSVPSGMYHVTPSDYAHSGFDRGHPAPHRVRGGRRTAWARARRAGEGSCRSSS